MHSVQAGMWDPRPPSKHASPLPQPPPANSRLAHVIKATPAKRITFYKSGDSQFGGIRMAVHKRSFKCFDALLDDLSQKVPLPFGVRTVTTPRGIHAIKHLEQLQDGGCYLCSDRRQAKPVNMELASKRPGIWYQHGRRPHRPETLSATPPDHLPYRQRRILLVKNSEPGMRRSVVLSRRSTRSLRAFLDEVSEVMQFHVRKLYTAEGRRIDSVQTLMTCPGVLVCVGREAFSPLLVNFIRKSSEEKLPGLGSRSPALGPRTPGNGARSPAIRSPPHGAQSRASEYSEGHESKKNVNFGLETKKSIIHPRSDSSNRSARFSLSSEKSYGNGVSYSQAKPAIMNEDIEKRVLVNKDGSLSVEMRVRFRLHNDETLQWSTQIKKSPSLTNECCPLTQAQPHYLQQGQSESCSDPDSTSFDPEGVDYSGQPLQHAAEGNRCPCCYQRQEQQYDLWENPAHSHKKPPVPPPHTSSHAHTMRRHTHSSSSSSSCNARRVVRCRKARLSSCGGGSGSEQSQLVQEEMCVTEQVEHTVEVEQDGDTHVEVCKVSRCCSRSDVVAVEGNLRPLSQKSVEDELIMEEEGERPLSAVSSSSHILQSLKEDLDDDLPPSVSQCSHRNETTPTFQTHLYDQPASNVSVASVRSAKHKRHEDREERGSGAVSTASSCHCGAASPHSTAGAEDTDRAPSSKPKMSRASCRSGKAKIPNSEEEGAADDEDEGIKRAVSGLSGHTAQTGASSVCHNCGGCKRGVHSVSNSRASQRSRHSHQASPKPATPLSHHENANDGSDDDDDDDGSDVSAVSTQSNKSNLTNHGRCSAMSNVPEDRASSAMSRASNADAEGKEEERAPSATSAASHRSNRSHKSGCNGNTGAIIGKEEERSPSATSARSKLSAKSSKSRKSNCSGTAEAPGTRTREEAEGENAVERPLSSLSAKSGASAKTGASVNLNTEVASPTDNTAVEEDDINERAPSALSGKSNALDKLGKAERPDSVLSAKSAKSNVSAKSGTSHRSTCSHCVRAVSPGAKAAEEPVVQAAGQEEEMEAKERAASAMSAKSNLSAKSSKSHKSTKASERSLSPESKTGGDREERAASQMSARSVKSNISVKSSKSCKSNYNGSEIAASTRVPEDKESENVEEETQERPKSGMSAKLENEERAASALSSKSHKSNHNENTGASSEIGDDTGDGEKAEDRAASALSGKSASSAKSHHTNCDTSSRVASPAREPAKTEAGTLEDRTPSAMSGKSHTSAKSSKSQKSNRTTASPNPKEADVPSIETNEEEKQNENQERGPSAMSVKSKSSVRSCTSHKSNTSKSPNVATIKTPEGVDEDGNETTERAPSAASARSGKSNVSAALSQKSNHNRAADIAVIETSDADEKTAEDNAPTSKSSEHSHGQTLSPRRTRSPRTHSRKAASARPGSPVRELLPGPTVAETRGPSALSVRSTASAKSGKSKCGCGAASAGEKAKKEVAGEECEEAPERAASTLSSTKRPRRESGGTEQALSRNSSGSVSLGLPEDQETADSDSGKSNFSFITNTKITSRVKTATPDVPKSTEQSAMKEDVEETGSVMSQKSNCNGNKSTLSLKPPAVDIPTIETTGGSEDKDEEGGGQKTERPASTLSAKSTRSHKSSCNCSVKAAAQMLDTKPKEQDAASTAKACNLDPSGNRTPSAMSSASAKSRSKSPAGASVKNASAAKSTAGDSANNDIKAASVHSKSPCCLRPESAVSAQSGSKVKASKESKGEDAVKSDFLNPVSGHKAKSDAGSNSGTVKTSSSQRKEAPIKSSSPCPIHSPRSGSKMETCSESTLSHSLSAADLLKETRAAARPHSRQSKASKASDKPRSEKSGKCQRGRDRTDQGEALELTPACLPNASPSDVVSDWLRSIPTNSSILAFGDELNEEVGEQGEEEKPEEGAAKEEEQSPEEEEVDKEEAEAEEGGEKEKDAECGAAGEEKSSDPAPGDAEGTPPQPNTQLLLSSESQPRNWHSSAAVMKVLLRSSQGRCQSMPEVSPVYGRRLSTSARGLLDCLAQLQLIEPAVSASQKGRNQQYEDIMGILQSLWLTEPTETNATEAKDVGTEQVTPPRSSSGVDMSSGSGGSGKENGNQGGDETQENKTKEDDGAEKVAAEEEEEEEGSAEAEHKETEAEPEETSSEEAKTDIAGEAAQSEEQSTVPPSLDSPKATENPSSSDKSSANDSSKSPTDNEREVLEGSSSGTPPTVLRAPFSKRLSQDPDPVWILNLLKKLEKQFMNHYINAMAEFKVRWDLDDSLILDTMISELRDEVSRRIQSSIEREMRKIQSRAGRVGRSPRPPKRADLSRESTMTERRRQMLKVMKNQSVKTADSLSDGEMTGDFSDQRSDDEYCPCDACVRKKMAARPLKTNPMAAEAPVMMEFDLLKILQLKKNPSPDAVPQPLEEKGYSEDADEKAKSLEVVQEEEEEDETKEDIKAVVVLEETIPEEDEEIGEEEDGGEAGEEEEVGAENEDTEENSGGDEEQEGEGETGGEEGGEEETSENEEEEAECQCQSVRNEEESDKAEEGEGEDAEETSDNTGEDEAAGEEEGGGAEDEGDTGGDEGETGTGEEEEEESDKETVKEATAGEGESTENGEGEEEEEVEREVSEFKTEGEEEEGETTGRESGEEEASGETTGDDSAERDASNEESAQEFAEGNVSASAEAEDEDDGEDDGTGEEESPEDENAESEGQEGKTSEEEGASTQGATAAGCVTEGEEADAEVSDTDNKSPTDTSADESGRGGDGGEEEVVEDAVREFKPEEEGPEEGGEANRNKRPDGALLHQITRTSVESQPGSLEDIDAEPPRNPANSMEVPKMAAGASTGGGAGRRRSPSPARVKRRKPKECDVEVE